MPVLTEISADAAALHRARALGQVRTAYAMIMTDPGARSLLAGSEESLADWLYARWWCGPGVLSSAGDEGDAGQHQAARGAALLEAARRSVAESSPGWLVLAAVADQLVAAPLPPGRRQDRRQTTADAVVASSRPGRAPRPGDLITLRQGEAGLDPSGGWWWAHTGRPEELTAEPLDRWYVHARDLTAAAELVRVLVSVAAEAESDISLKCSPRAAGYGRRDALVVYLPRARSASAEQALLRRASELTCWVEPEVPPLTRQLLPGVAQAQDPGAADGSDAVSYGQLRCRQVASLATRWPDGPGPTDDDLVAALAELGIDVDAPERVR